MLTVLGDKDSPVFLWNGEPLPFPVPPNSEISFAIARYFKGNFRKKTIRLRWFQPHAAQ